MGGEGREKERREEEELETDERKCASQLHMKSEV